MEEKIYIFGVHSRAWTLSRYLLYLNPNTTVAAFLYDNEEQNPVELDGIAVLCLNTHVHLYQEYPVYIGTRGIYHAKIIEKLKKAGFEKIYPVTFEMDLKLRNMYLEKYYTEIGRQFLKIDKLPRTSCELDNLELDRKRANIYVVKSIYDQCLQQPYQYCSYERIIQAGTAIGKTSLEDRDAADDQGENISDRNVQFCELTALYWLWKNAEEDIVGLAHYRRHFILPEDWVERMEQNHIDVILPTPLYVAPNLKENYKARHETDAWDYMMQCIKEDNEEMYKDAERFFESNLYSPCNMFIMRREVLDALCRWLFPILFKVAAYIGNKEDRYQNRYPGFLSERLLTFFFERNSEKYKMVFADKNFLA